MDINVCACCSTLFVKKGKNFLRRSCRTSIHGRTVVDVLKSYGIVCTDKQFVCSQCFVLVNKTAALECAVDQFKIKTSQPVERQVYIQTPVETPRKVEMIIVDTSPLVASVASTPKQSSQTGKKAEAKSMDISVCACCSNSFVKKGKNFLRRLAKTKVHGRTVEDVLNRFGIGCTEEQFVCNLCFNLVKKTATLINAAEELESRMTQPVERKHDSRTPVKTPSKVKKRSSQKGWKAEAISAIENSKFTSALKHLMKSRSFGRAFVRCVTARVRREARGYANHGGRRLGSEVTAETMASFSWDSITKELKCNLPVLHASLTGALTSQRNMATKLHSSGNGFGKALPVMGMVFAQLFFNRFPRKFSFIQELCALEMWSSGCSQKLFQHFQRLGICKGLKDATNSVIRFRKDFDKEVCAGTSNNIQ